MHATLSGYSLLLLPIIIIIISSSGSNRNSSSSSSIIFFQIIIYESMVIFIDINRNDTLRRLFKVIYLLFQKE